MKPDSRNRISTSYESVLTSFCHWTSIRGLQHLVRSEHPVLRTIWGIFVALMLLANVGLVTLLLIHYFQYNTIENIRTLNGVQVEFPHVTLCNVDPVNSHRIHCLQNPNSTNCRINSKYHNILDKYKEANNYLKAYKNSIVWSKLEDPSMVAIFYQLIGMEAASHIGHQFQDFIMPIFCEVTTREKGGILLKRKCENATVIPLNLITYKYFNCYTLSVQDSRISSNIVRLSVILYLDEEEDLKCRPYCTHEFTDWVGGKVVIHSAGSYPVIETSSMNLLPGASNQILIDEMRLIEKKNIKSKPCEQESRNLSVVYYDAVIGAFKTRMMKYTSVLCIQLLSQTATMKECHCIDFLMPVPGEHKDLLDKLPFCGNLSRIKVNESLACSQRVRQKNSKHFRNLCPIACTQMQYNYELTQLRWPQKPKILNYYEDIKKHMNYDTKFKIYEEIEKLSHENPTAALSKLQSTDVFEKNFLHVDVNRPNFDTLVNYCENEEYTLPTLLSQIGGICSIFLSFTCVTVLELIELAIRLIGISFPAFILYKHSSNQRIYQPNQDADDNATNHHNDDDDDNDNDDNHNNNNNNKTDNEEVSRILLSNQKGNNYKNNNKSKTNQSETDNVITDR